MNLQIKGIHSPGNKTVYPRTDLTDAYRIVGGYTAKKNKPWIAKLWIVQHMICGASLINSRYDDHVQLPKFYKN